MADLETKVNKTLEELTKKAHVSKLCIGVSGGKDSLCLCELVKMAGITNVGYFFMRLLPNEDLRIENELLAYPITRFNIPEDGIQRFCSPVFFSAMHYSVFTWYAESNKKAFPAFSRTDIFKAISKQMGGLIVTGVKKCDSLQMMRMINNNRGIACSPMRDWNLNDVLTFMKLRKIDIPKLTKEGCRGVGLEDGSIQYIYEHYYDDFLRIEKYFPFVRAAILKFKYFNLHRSLRIV